MRQADIRLKPKRRGNYVPGKGRPPGSRNRSTIELEKAMEAAQERLLQVAPQMVDIDAHGLLTVVYRDSASPIFLRVQAAQAAIRYEKPALSSTQLDATVAVRLGVAQELVAANARLSAAEAAKLAAADTASAKLASFGSMNIDGSDQTKRSAYTTAHTRVADDTGIGLYAAGLASSIE